MTARTVGDSERRESFLPPEGVPISFVIAPMGTRIGAQLIDILITYGFVYLLVILMIATINLIALEAQFTLIVLFVFLIRVPYYILSELIWNGQTLGKRFTAIRVINAKGRRLTPHQIVTRNLMKEAEFFTPGTMLVAAVMLSPVEVVVMLIWTFTVLIVPLANRRRQRLGDMAAGTLVVRNPRNNLLPDMAVPDSAARNTQSGFDFLPEHLGIYGRLELQTLENVLRNPVKNPQKQSEIDRIARTIINKVGYGEPVKPGQEWQFLNAFYRAQREHLEMLRLFGTRREDKFHDHGSPPGQQGSDRRGK